MLHITQYHRTVCTTSLHITTYPSTVCSISLHITPHHSIYITALCAPHTVYSTTDNEGDRAHISQPHSCSVAGWCAPYSRAKTCLTVYPSSLLHPRPTGVTFSFYFSFNSFFPRAREHEHANNKSSNKKARQSPSWVWGSEKLKQTNKLRLANTYIGAHCPVPIQHTPHTTCAQYPHTPHVTCALSDTETRAQPGA